MNTLKVTALSTLIVLATSCGSGSASSGGSSSNVVDENVTSVVISGQVDLNGANLESPATAPTVKVNEVDATVTATAFPDLFDWTATVTATSTYDDYRVEYFVNDNLIRSVDYSLDP